MTPTQPEQKVIEAVEALVDAVWEVSEIYDATIVCREISVRRKAFLAALRELREQVPEIPERLAICESVNEHGAKCDRPLGHEGVHNALGHRWWHE
jgi:hypothetical protein